jgi:hypothetical protein
MAIVYKTAQVSATGWTDFGPILTLKPARQLCYSALKNAHQNGALVRK